MTKGRKELLTYSYVKSLAKNCKTRNEFRTKHPSAYAKSRNNGWHEEICSHMPSRAYSIDECKTEALKYTRRVDFDKGSPGHASRARKKGWYEIVCSHIPLTIKPVGHWGNIDNARKEALKYNSRAEFQKGSISAYDAAWRKGFLDEICSHMTTVGGYNHRYVYEIADHNLKIVYVGLTCNPDERWQHHKDTRRIIKYFDNAVKMEVLTDLLPAKVAQVKEEELINSYRNRGYKVLNKAKGGALGGKREYYTEKNCAKIANRFTTYKDFRENEPLCYAAACRKGFIDKICLHMTDKRRGYYSTKERCLEAALRYPNRSEFHRGAYAAWVFAKSNNWLDEICSHMPSRTQWSKELCRKDALTCITRAEYKNRFPSSYATAWKKGWLDEVCYHMRKPWSKAKRDRHEDLFAPIL